MKINRLVMSVMGAVMCVGMLGFSAAGNAAEGTGKPKADTPRVSTVASTININTASVEALAELNGVGEKKAADIIAYREANGKFVKVEDLLNVKGIGEKTLEKNRQRLSVN
jgi:competence protein ComEA